MSHLTDEEYLEQQYNDSKHWGTALAEENRKNNDGYSPKFSHGSHYTDHLSKETWELIEKLKLTIKTLDSRNKKLNNVDKAISILAKLYELHNDYIGTDCYADTTELFFQILDEMNKEVKNENRS
jgi:hypothetical protein